MCWSLVWEKGRVRKTAATAHEEAVLTLQLHTSWSRGLVFGTQSPVYEGELCEYLWHHREVLLSSWCPAYHGSGQRRPLQTILGAIPCMDSAGSSQEARSPILLHILFCGDCFWRMFCNFTFFCADSWMNTSSSYSTNRFLAPPVLLSEVWPLQFPGVILLWDINQQWGGGDGISPAKRVL